MKKHFTLIELLVVIGIIAVLAAMLMPALSKAREKANQADCTNLLKQIGTAMMMYAGDYKNQLPVGIKDKDGTAVDPDADGDDEFFHNRYAFANMIYTDYMKSPKVFVCRSTKNAAAADVAEMLADTAKDTAEGGSKSKERSSFLYYGGFTSTEVDSEVGIARDKNKNHKNYGNVLYGDGHVEGVPGSKKDGDDWHTKDNNLGIDDSDNDLTIEHKNSLW